jgi:hypothetical protein
MRPAVRDSDMSKVAFTFRAVLAVVAALPWACDGRGGECRTQGDCDAPEECIPPEQDDPVCGMGCQVENSCPEDRCPEEQVCVEYLGLCCGYGATLSSKCVPACPASPCAAGETCDASGRCVADSCTAGFTCRAHFVCDESNPGADFHGCSRGACTHDSGCDGGVCVDGRCFDSAGTCAEPELVP